MIIDITHTHICIYIYIMYIHTHTHTHTCMVYIMHIISIPLKSWISQFSKEQSPCLGRGGDFPPVRRHAGDPD